MRLVSLAEEISWFAFILVPKAAKSQGIWAARWDAAQKILELHKSVELRTALAISARRLIEATLSWEFVGAQISRSARQVLAEREEECSTAATRVVELSR
jgi:hypothetical protein